MIKCKCQQCGKEYSVRPSVVGTTKYCSKKCKDEAQRKTVLGNKNPNWKGGLTSNYKEWHKKQQGKWRKKNPEKVNAINRRYYRKHKEKAEIWRQKTYQKIKDKLKITRRQWEKKNKEKCYHYHKIYQWRKKSSGHFTLGEWELLKKQYNYTCPACGKKEPEIKLEIDHIIPLSKGGSNWIENIQPLCRSCNAKKHTNYLKYVPTK